MVRKDRTHSAPTRKPASHLVRHHLLSFSAPVKGASKADIQGCGRRRPSCRATCQSGANCFSRTRHFLCQCRRMCEQRFLTRSIIQVRRSRAPSQTQDRRRLSRYMRRWLVERFFAWIQWQPPILVRWEYHAQNFLGLPRYPLQAILRPFPVTASKRNRHSQI
jgi:hypothetical protein